MSLRIPSLLSYPDWNCDLDFGRGAGFPRASWVFGGSWVVTARYLFMRATAFLVTAASGVYCEMMPALRRRRSSWLPVFFLLMNIFRAVVDFLRLSFCVTSKLVVVLSWVMVFV